MRKKRLNVKCFYVSCKEEEDFNEEFGSGQFKDAKEYLAECRAEFPGYEFKLYAEVEP